MTTNHVRERVALYGLSGISDDDLLTELVGCGMPEGWPELAAMGKLSPAELEAKGWSGPRALRIAIAFELGRRGAWASPKRGERCLDPGRVYELFRDVAHNQVEEFWVATLDVRGRLLGRHRIGQGSISQCPVSPRDMMRPCVAEGAHGLIMVHNHPSGDPAPSPEDVDLTQRLCAAAEIVGIKARDHVIVSTGGYFSFVEAGRWRR